MKKLNENEKKVEYRYYVIPENEQVLALTGDSWRREYGEGLNRLHFHNYFEAGLCFEGTGKVVFEDEIREFGPGSIMLTPPNYPHTTNVEAGTTAYWEWIYFDMEAVVNRMFTKESELEKQEILEYLYRTPLLIRRTDCPTISATIELILEEAKRKRSMYRDNISSFLRILVVELLRLRERAGKHEVEAQGMVRIRPALEYVQAHYAEEIRISKLAEVCNVSESHFRRIFFKYTNMKPVDYINFIRVENSCTLLKRADLTLSEIAYSCGFGNVTTLTRNFKKILNATPYQWQKAAAGREMQMKRYRISAYKGWE